VCLLILACFTSERLSAVRLSSVMFVRPTQPVEIFGSVSAPFSIHGKFYGDRPRGTPPSGVGVKRKRGNRI